MNKTFYQSKTIWGFIGFSVFGILNIFYPSDMLSTLIIASLGWAGYGFRDAMR